MNPAPPVTSSRPNARSSPTSGDRPRDGWRQPPGGIVLGGHLGRAQERRDGPGVGPVPTVDGAEQVAGRDVVIEHVGDLELPAAGWQEVVDHSERIWSK